MERILQPCDWYEHDAQGKYVVDVFGRTDQDRVACLRITGFKPFFYVKGRKPSVGNCKMVSKYDVFAGFHDLKTTDVWQVECATKLEFNNAVKSATGSVLYESNIPPFLRLFHARHLGPASPIRFQAIAQGPPIDRETEEPLFQVEEFYTCEYTKVEAAPDANIPLLVACYDLEMYSASGMFPRALAGDPIIQIGISYRWSDDMLEPSRRVVFVVGDVDPSEDDTEFVACRDEEDMLRRFAAEIKIENPDIMCGYNTFGFDDAYIEDRCKALGILDDICLGRCAAKTKDMNGIWRNRFSETKKFELASGKYDLRYLMLRGRLGLDLLLNMRREHSLDSFKLDNVASEFLHGKVNRYGANYNEIFTYSTRGLRNGNYVRFDHIGNTREPLFDGRKFEIYEVTKTSFRIRADTPIFDSTEAIQFKGLEWTFSKDDVSPEELFRLHATGGPAGRARIAKYCIQDCDLVLTLMAKLDTIVNARGMADVCKVPMEFVLRRGQGIKIFSAVLYYASQRDQILRVQQAMEFDTGYEGAIVLPPKIGMYLDQPISVLDFNSLYPTNMIAYNLSPDTLVAVRVFDSDGHRIEAECEGYAKDDHAQFEAKGYTLEEISYDNKNDKGDVVGKTICTYAQPTENPMTVGILPKTLDILLKKRKEFKQKMEDTQYDEAQRSVFNGLQLAYKVVANSVYGQTGSRTSPIRKLCVAASTTSAGRKALGLAKRVVETEFGASVVYGDTDSIFVKFPTTDLAESIRLGIQAGERITSQCRRPYKIAYEKTFYPFILFCRKRYVGMMYEEDATAKPKRKSMGIVLKRRDNAPIVKDVFGGALDILMEERNIKKAQAFVHDMLGKVLTNQVALEKFIITKSLRDDYKNPDQIAHRVLADRMARRDPGTAPKVGDRLPFIYISGVEKGAKQGDRIEHLDYVRANKLQPDTTFYITNQIQNPVAQLFALCIEQLDGYRPPSKQSYQSLYQDFLDKFQDHDEPEEDATIALLARKEKQLDDLMFLNNPALVKLLRKNTRGPMDAFVRRA